MAEKIKGSGNRSAWVDKSMSEARGLVDDALKAAGFTVDAEYNVTVNVDDSQLKDAQQETKDLEKEIKDLKRETSKPIKLKSDTEDIKKDIKKALQEPYEGPKITRSQKSDDGSYEKQYVDELGHTHIQGQRNGKDYTKDIIQFTNLEGDAARLTNALADANAELRLALSQGLDGTDYVKSIQNTIELLNDKLKAIEDQIDVYDRRSRRGEMEDPYTRELYEYRVGERTGLYASKVDQKTERQLLLQKSKETKAELDEYANAMQTYERLSTQKLNKGALNAEELKQMAAALKTIADTEEKWNEAKTEGVDLTKKQKETEQHLYKAEEERIKGNKDYTKDILEQNALNKKATDEYNKLNNRLEKMKGQAQWKADPEEWIKRIEGMQDELGNLNIDVKNQDDLDKLLASLQQLEKERQALSKDPAMQPISIDWQDKSLANLNKWMDQNKMAAKEYADQLKYLQDTVGDVTSKAGAEEWISKFSAIQADAADKGLLGKSLGDRFKDQFANTMTSLATYYLSFQDFIRYGREAISIVTELDTQLTEMRKVSDESLQTLQDYQLESFDIAGRVGTTAAQIQSSTADWMRLGETLTEAKKSAEYSTLLMNVSEFSSINDATDSLVSMSQAFKDIDKLEIIDKLNNIGNNFSISTSDLAQSLQKSSGALITAGSLYCPKIQKYIFKYRSNCR